VYEAFRGAIADREAKGLTADLKFVGIDSASIASSRVEGDAMLAVTDFASNQVRVTRDKDGNVVEGDPSRIDLVRDRWTFSRKTASNDPNWVLVATGGAA
jgi:predicted lipid-binding transport protein (Tim44 family)